MDKKIHYYLMISCPNDVEKERTLLQNCVDSINKERDDNSFVELVHWITNTASDAGMPAQDSINEQMVKKSDGLIAIFNARLGTPVHTYCCGTEEEMELMLAAGKHVSLLFNSKPQLDLKRDDSVEQIAKLVEFKKKQAGKAYYKEFFDEESFKNTAKQEIVLWLRNLVAKGYADNNPEQIDDGQENIKVISTDNIADNEKTKALTTDSGYDPEAGIIDIVIYVTEETKAMSEDLEKYNVEIQYFASITSSFSDKILFLKKQPNSQTASVIAIKQFAHELNEFSRKTITHAELFDQKWSLVFNYIRVYIKSNAVLSSDKYILKDSLLALKSRYENFCQVLANQSGVLATMPNVQKDFTKATKEFDMAVKKFSDCIRTAISNCDELILAIE